MEKDGTNTFQSYKYLSETQITFKMKTLLDKHGVMFTYSAEVKSCVPFTTSKGGSQNLTTVAVKYRFNDVESDESLDGVVDGQGADTGDKGVYKAITGAIKYIYMKTFNIPTGDDPENDKRSKKDEKKIDYDKPPFGKGSEEDDQD